MSVVAVYNLKGGVGKTATTVNLAYSAAGCGQRVLAWDLDPQGATSFYLRLAATVDGGAEHLIEKRKRLVKAARETEIENLSLVPADWSYRHLDIELSESKHGSGHLQRMLGPARDSYDLVLLDCPPSLSTLAENIFAAVDVLLVPLVPSPLSLRSYRQIESFLDDMAATSKAPMLLPFFSMVDRRRKLHRENVGTFARAHPEVLRVFIPYSAEVEKMGIKQAPVGAFAPASMPAQAYGALYQALADRLSAPPAG